MEQHTISVVIPAFNAAKFIGRTIDSVLAQTYRDYEIIVVDDGSTDNTAEVIKSYGLKVRYIYQANAGDGPARNTGIAAAKGDWIAFLDHDDEWLPEKLQLQMSLLNKHPNLHWCGANYYRKYGMRQAPQGNVEKLSNVLGSSNYFENFFTAIHKLGCQIITSTTVIRKDVFEKAGLFDSKWLRCADLDMWWRVAYHYPRIGYLAQPLAIMHLDVQTGASKLLALEDTRPTDALQLVACHLELAQRCGAINEFKPLASQVLHRSLRTTLFHGLKKDARQIIRKFPDLFTWYVRCGIILLTVLPRLTSILMRTVSLLRHSLGLKREITRRYSHAEVLRVIDKDQA